MEENYKNYTFWDFFKEEPWWNIFLSVVSFVSAVIAIIYYGIYFITIIFFVIIVVILVNQNKKILSKYNEMALRLNKIQLLTDTLGSYIGYKRELYHWKLSVEEDESSKEEKTLIIRSFQELREIILFNVTYPNANIEGINKNFISERGGDYKGNIEPNITLSGEKIIYSIRFDPNLPKNSRLKIKTVPIQYPAGALTPEVHFDKLITEGGQAIKYKSYIPTDRLEMELILPKNRKHAELNCVGNGYCIIAPIDSENFMFNKMNEVNCELEREYESPTDNIIRLNIDHPVFGLEYGLCWKWKP